MLHSISWQQYLLFLIIILFLYYLFVWVVYYKARIPSFPGIKNSRDASAEEDQPNEVQGNSQLIIKEIKSVFRGRQNKNELIYSLQSKLNKYNQWDEPGFRETINEFIVKESKQQCSIHLSEEDLRVLWL